MHIFVGW